MPIALVRRTPVLACLAAVVLAGLVPPLVAPADAQSLPARWSFVDSGKPPVAGGATFVAPTFSVASQAFDVNGTADQFSYAYRKISGDVTLVARVVAEADTDPWAQTGLMIREGSSVGSLHAYLFVTPANGVVLRSRRVRNAATSEVTGSAGTAPIWLKLERRGSSVIASHSTNGVTWSAVSTLDIPFSSTVMIGMAVTSHSKVAKATATIDNLTVNGIGWTGAPNAAPAVSLTAPTDNSTYAVATPVAIAATATDSDGTVAKVDFYAGATLVGTDITSPFAATWNAGAPGSYAIKAVATDNAGMTASSAVRTVTVLGLNVPPSVVVITDKVSYVTPASVIMTAAAVDLDGKVAKVDFYAGATLVRTDTSSPYVFSWTGATAGIHAIRAVATDNKGASTTSLMVNITVSAPNVAPTVSLTSPAHGATFVSPATVTLSANATDSDGTVQKVEFYVGATRVATDTTKPFSVTWSAPVGTHSVSAMATDNLGAVTVSAWRDFTVTATPVVSKAIFKPATPADAVDYYLLEVFVSGADPRTAAPIATQHLGLPPVVNNECTADVRSLIVALAPGNYIATVSAMSDTEGKLRSPSFAFTR